MSLGDVAAIAALALSVFSLWRQRKYDERAKHLNDLLIQKETNENISAKRADLFANFVNTGKSRYQFKIYNRGKGTARNIKIEVLDGEELLRDSDLNQKFPFPSLEHHQTINLPVWVHMQSPRRATVTLTWDDDAGGGEKQITDDVF